VIDVSPAIVIRDAPPDPSRTAEPERVSVPVAVRPAFEEAPIEMIPAAWMMSPLTARSNDPIAIVPVHPDVLSEAAATFRLIVTVPPPEFASKKTGFEELGTEHPFTPPDESAQWPVWGQLPVPPIQYRLPPQGDVRRTSTTGSEPSIVKMICPEPFTSPFVKSTASFVTLNRCPVVFPPMVKVIVEVATVDEWVHR